MDIVENRYRMMIIEPELSGKSISEVCAEFRVSRETWYKWKKRYDIIHGIVGLKDQSRKPHTIAKVKVIEELEKIILELRLNSRFGPIRIKYRLKKEKVWS
jgi:transposase